ncbi:hypothetical protein [Nocardiopsis sp. NPDC006938]|uniref:hypothetical protein n=1 Tax=Nocardiopsis sp. NPDC006938 TaxID=3364337 RepID=UPI0036893228
MDRAAALRLPPPPLPIRLTGVHVRSVRQTSCGGHVALVWFDAGPAHGHADVEFVDASSSVDEYGERPPEEFARAFLKGLRSALEDAGGGRPPHSTRVVLRALRWSVVDSHPRGFEIAGRRAATEITKRVRNRPEPPPGERSLTPRNDPPNEKDPRAAQEHPGPPAPPRAPGARGSVRPTDQHHRQ